MRRLFFAIESETVDWVPLGAIADIRTGSRPSDQQLQNGGDYLYFNGGVEASGAVGEHNSPGNLITIPARGSVGVVAYQEQPIWLGPLCYGFHHPDGAVATKFLYLYLKSIQRSIEGLQQTGSIPALNKGSLAKVLVPKVSLEIQSEIVAALEPFERLEGELAAELAARRKQYEFYRDQLLTFPEEGAVRWLPMGEFAHISTGSTKSKDQIASNPGPYPVVNSGREPLGWLNEYNTVDEPLGVTSRGAGVGSITWTEGKYFRGGLNYGVRIRPGYEISSRYLYHWLENNQVSVQALATFDGIPALNKGNLEKLMVPVPTMEDQSGLVARLDQLDALVNDIRSGLPAELAARRKQYQYYRDKLLAFPEKVA